MCLGGEERRTTKRGVGKRTALEAQRQVAGVAQDPRGVEGGGEGERHGGRGGCAQGGGTKALCSSRFRGRHGARYRVARDRDVRIRGDHVVRDRFLRGHVVWREISRRGFVVRAGGVYWVVIYCVVILCGYIV